MPGTNNVGTVSDEFAEFPATARLLDGRVVSLRRLGADDAQPVMDLHWHLEIELPEFVEETPTSAANVP